MKDKNFEPLKKFLEFNDMDYEITENHKANLNVSEKNGFYIYNYNNNVLVPRDDPIIRMCRGLVLDKSGLLYNMPFNRFFNYHESECDNVDISNAEIQEKLDGSLVFIWNTGTEWEVTTRGSFYPNQDSFNFKEKFIELFDKFDKLEIGNCYMFELISSGNRIVTKYNDEFVVLLGARNTGTMEEFSQIELDEIAKKLEVKRPKRFKATNIEECKELFDNMRDDEEGLVIVDNNFNRFKLKQESYLKMAKIISLKEQDVLDYVLGRVELDEDFTNMKELKEKVEQVKLVYNRVKNYSEKIFRNIKHIKDKKEFASHATKYKISGILFKMQNGLNIDDLDIRWKRLLEYSESIIEPKEKTIIILRGIPGSGKSTWIKENELDIYSISMDTLRLMYSAPNPYISQEYNNNIYKLTMDIIRTRMSNGSFTVYDATNITDKSIKDIIKLANEFDYKIKEVVSNINLEDALQRNNVREEYKKVPEEVIKRMHNQFTEKFINTKIFNNA